jgi:hypothetical protein
MTIEVGPAKGKETVRMIHQELAMTGIEIGIPAETLEVTEMVIEIDDSVLHCIQRNYILQLLSVEINIWTL